MANENTNTRDPVEHCDVYAANSNPAVFQPSDSANNDHQGHRDQRDAQTSSSSLLEQKPGDAPKRFSPSDSDVSKSSDATADDCLKYKNQGMEQDDQTSVAVDLIYTHGKYADLSLTGTCSATRKSYIIKCHKEQLAQKSSYFEMRLHEKQEILEMPAYCQVDVLQQVILYVYHNSCELETSNLGDIFALAGTDMLNINGLTEYCTVYLLENLNDETAVSFMELCSEFCLVEEKKIIQKYIVQQYLSIRDTVNLSFENIRDVLTEIKFTSANTDQIYASFTEWRSKHLHDMHGVLILQDLLHNCGKKLMQPICEESCTSVQDGNMMKNGMSLEKETGKSVIQTPSCSKDELSLGTNMPTVPQCMPRSGNQGVITVSVLSTFCISMIALILAVIIAQQLRGAYTHGVMEKAEVGRNMAKTNCTELKHEYDKRISYMTERLDDCEKQRNEAVKMRDKCEAKNVVMLENCEEHKSKRQANTDQCLREVEYREERDARCYYYGKTIIAVCTVISVVIFMVLIISNPRSECVATDIVFVIIGILMMLGTLSFWSLSILYYFC